MWKRIFADIILFLSLFFAPWYVAAVLGAVFIIIFPRFWEAAVLGLFLDSFYHSYQLGQLIYGRFGIFTLSALILLVTVSVIKRRIRI